MAEVDTVMLEAFSRFGFESVAQRGETAGLEAALGLSLPSDWKHLVETCGTGEGWVGSHYLILYPPKDLLRLNEEYEVGEYAPGFLVFGSDGGGEAFAFDLEQVGYPIVMLPWIGMSREDAALVARNLTELVGRMENGDDLP